MEAVFIKRKSIMAVTVLFIFALSFSTSTAFAAASLQSTPTTNSDQITINGNSYTQAQIEDANNRVSTFQETNNRLPTYVTISGNKIPINDFLPYLEENNNPTYNSTNTSTNNSSSGVSFTSAQINNASKTVKTFVESNNRLPNFITINSYQVTMPQFLQLMTQNILNIYNGLKSTVTLSTVSSPSSATGNFTSANIYKSEYIKIATSVDSFIDSNGKAPGYVSSTLGNIKFDTLVYTFSKILTYQATNNRLPSYVSVTSSIIQDDTSNNSSDGVLRPIYIFSDNINSKTYDNERINLLVNALKALGATAYNSGAGTDNYAILRNTPSNALIVQINGGVCAGTIKDMASAYYKGLVGTKEVFMVFTEGATKITGLAWMPRAHDDNFSPASFTGLANPDLYLLNNGYNYYEGYTNSLVNILAQILYQEATS